MAQRQGFDAFYSASYRRIVGQVFALLGDLHDAEDVTQDAFAKASFHWSRIAAYDQPEIFPSVIDASGVTFLDCRGLGFLIRQTGAARRAGRRPLLRRPPRIVRRVIDLAEANELFTVTA